MLVVGGEVTVDQTKMRRGLSESSLDTILQKSILKIIVQNDTRIQTLQWSSPRVEKDSGEAILRYATELVDAAVGGGMKDGPWSSPGVEQDFPPLKHLQRV